MEKDRLKNLDNYCVITNNRNLAIKLGHFTVFFNYIASNRDWSKRDNAPQYKKRLGEVHR